MEMEISWAGTSRNSFQWDWIYTGRESKDTNQCRSLLSEWTCVLMVLLGMGVLEEAKLSPCQPLSQRLFSKVTI